MRVVLELQGYLGGYSKNLDGFDTRIENACDALECNLDRMTLLQGDLTMKVRYDSLRFHESFCARAELKRKGVVQDTDQATVDRPIVTRNAFLTFSPRSDRHWILVSFDS
jgi:hypothetical protein